MGEKTVYIIDIDDKARGKLKDIQGEAKKTDSGFKDLQNTATNVFAGFALKEFATDVIQTTARFQSLSNSIKFASDTAGQGELSLLWLKDLSNIYGLPLEQLTEGFKTFQGAMMNTKFTSTEVRNMFAQVSTGATAMGLSAEDAKGVFLALGQIMGKGKVQAEELRGQIGERVPGAFSIAARAMSMTTSELDKFMSDGKLLAEDFLPKFAAEMEKTFGQGAIDNTDSLTANINRMSDAWTKLVLVIGNDQEGLVTKTMTGWTKMLDNLIYNFSSLDDLVKERANGGTLDVISSLESTWKAEIVKMKKAGKSRDEIESFIQSKVSDTKSNWSIAEEKRRARISSIEKENGLVDKKPLGGMIPIVNSFSATTKKDFAAENDGYAKLLEHSQRNNVLMKELQPLSDKLISSLYMPSNTPAESSSKKTKRSGSGSSGLNLNESKNGSTQITFNIDTFQKNEFTKDGSTATAQNLKSILDQMALGLMTVANDSQIAMR